MRSQPRSTRFLAAAAMTGLVAGAATVNFGCKSDANGSGTSMSSPGTSGDTATMAKHSCKGMNGCKGQGGCNTGDNGCKGKNSCKGKGGCATDK
jgi:hypothetical protein